VQVGSVVKLGFHVGVVCELGVQVEVCRSGCCGFLGFHSVMEQASPPVKENPLGKVLRATPMTN
jgi:hypothetical protein